MRLHLNEIINVPGGEVPFSYGLDVSDLSFDGVASMSDTLSVSGKVRNIAGMLIMTARVTGDMTCICARCLDEFERNIDLDIEAVLADELQDEDNPDIFLLDGDYIDLDEVIITYFVLNMDQKFLCSEDCKGLCEKCGKNLNDGPCECRPDIDPRLAALQQLLDND